MYLPELIHWGRVTHICDSKLTIIGSDNGLSPGRRLAIIWTIAGILLIEPLGLNFSEILIKISTFSFKKIHLKISSAKWRLFRLGLNVLNTESIYVGISFYAFPLLLDNGQSWFWYHDHIVSQKQVMFIVMRSCHCGESYQLLVGGVWCQYRRVRDFTRESHTDGLVISANAMELLQSCSKLFALAMVLLQYCAKPSI